MLSIPHRAMPIPSQEPTTGYYDIQHFYLFPTSGVTLAALATASTRGAPSPFSPASGDASALTGDDRFCNRIAAVKTPLLRRRLTLNFRFRTLRGPLDSNCIGHPARGCGGANWLRDHRFHAPRALNRNRPLASALRREIMLSQMFDLGRTFLAAVERSPDATAIADGKRRLGYLSWYEEIARIAGGLTALGLRRATVSPSSCRTGSKWRAGIGHASSPASS
jgi:hypothetical protein